MRPYIVIAIITLALNWPGLFTLPPLDRDESRYAQATVQMLETGDFVEIQFQDQPRNKKPVGIHWLQAVSVTLFSNIEKREIWAFRIPSLIGVILASLFTYWGTSRIFNPKVGFLSAILLPCTLVVAGEATIAKTDGALLACITASQLALAKLYTESQHNNRFSLSDLAWSWRLSPTACLFWAALGLGTLIKGPVAPLVTSLTCATLIAVDRRFGWMKALAPLSGGAIALAIVLPWVIAIWIKTNGQFFIEAFLVDVGPKMTSNQETHGAPPGYYTLLSPLLLWPLSLFLIPASLNAWRLRLTPGIKFCLAWIIPTWLFFEIAPTKLPHYVMPTFPAIAALCSVYIFRQGRMKSPPDRTQDFLHLGNAMFWLILSVALAAILSLMPIFFNQVAPPPAIIYGSLAIAILSVIVYLIQIHAQRQSAAYGVVLLSAVSFFVILQIALPSMKQLDVSRSLQRAILEQTGGEKTLIISSGYVEPSLVFLTATNTKLVPAATAAQLLAQNPSAIAIIDETLESDFIEQAKVENLLLERAAFVNGFNYSNGENVNLTLFKGTIELPEATPDTDETSSQTPG